jgi:hypothetical protein
MRGNHVKWPTIRKAWLIDESVEEIRQYVQGRGRSIIFLDGVYKTNLNQWCGKDPEERAVFFEFLVKHPRVMGGIYVLSWIGNYHNGSIIHFGWQYPQVRCWRENTKGTESFLEGKVFTIYKEIVRILYRHSEHDMDDEVREFLMHTT